jgi:chorismate mutase/prephenate dehydratase
MNLDELRKQVDNVDKELIKLISHRVRLAEQIGEIKHALGRQVLDKKREEEVLTSIRRMVRQEGLSELEIEEIFRQIIVTSRDHQQRIEVVFQGATGAYSEEAAFRHFGAKAQTRACETLDEVFQTVEKDEAEFGIVPIENSLEGSISRTYELILDSSLMVCSELEVKIAHCLIASPGATLDSIKRIYSHPQALGQCQKFLKHLNCELIPTYDTAGSVKMIKEKNIANGAAIASLRASEIYNMKVLARDIQDNTHNYTRFFVLSKQDTPPSGNDKTSIVFSVKHKPGALYNFLKDLTDSKLNMTKIESRPTRQQPWDYNFYLDFEGHRKDKKVVDAIARLAESALFIKVLGSYPKTVNRRSTQQ